MITIIYWYVKEKEFQDTWVSINITQEKILLEKSKASESFNGLLTNVTSKTARSISNSI